MSRKTDERAEAGSSPARFPALRVAACGAGLLVAAYVWMGWGFAWDVTPGDLVRGGPPVGFRGWEGRYVRVRGRPYCADSYEEPTWRFEVWSGPEHLREELHYRTVLVDPQAGAGGHKTIMWSCEPIWADLSEDDLAKEDVALEERPVCAAGGRVVRKGRQLGVDGRLARVNGVGLIGVVVAFWSAVFLYLWLADWRRAMLRREALRGAGDHAGGE